MQPVGIVFGGAAEGDRAKGVDQDPHQEQGDEEWANAASIEGQEQHQVGGVVDAEAEAKLGPARVLVEEGRAARWPGW